MHETKEKPPYTYILCYLCCYASMPLCLYLCFQLGGAMPLKCNARNKRETAFVGLSSSDSHPPLLLTHPFSVLTYATKTKVWFLVVLSFLLLRYKIETAMYIHIYIYIYVLLALCPHRTQGFLSVMYMSRI